MVFCWCKSASDTHSSDLRWLMLVWMCWSLTNESSYYQIFQIKEFIGILCGVFFFFLIRRHSGKFLLILVQVVRGFSFLFFNFHSNLKATFFGCKHITFILWTKKSPTPSPIFLLSHIQSFSLRQFLSLNNWYILKIMFRSFLAFKTTY